MFTVVPGPASYPRLFLISEREQRKLLTECLHTGLESSFPSIMKTLACLFKLEDVKPDPGAGNITSVNPRMPGNSSAGGRGRPLRRPACLSAGITCRDCTGGSHAAAAHVGRQRRSRPASHNPVACRNDIWVPETGSETQEE